LVLIPVAARAQDAEQAKELVAKAQELAKSKELAPAIALMQKAVDLAPRNDSYLAFLSDLEYKAGKYAAGLEHAAQAIKLNDKVGAYYTLAALNAYKDQEIDRARAYCETVLKRGSDFGSAAVKMAEFILQEYLGKRTFTLFWKLDPKRGEMVKGTLSIAMPKTGLPYQTVTYEIAGVKSHKLVKGDANDMLVVVPGTEPFPLTIKVSVSPYSYKKDLAKASSVKTLSADAKANLGPIHRVDPKSPAVKKIAAGLKAGDRVATVHNIQAWLKKNIDYKQDTKKLTDTDFDSIDDIIRRGHGDCLSHTMLFVGLCRAADVPARPIWGIFRQLAGDGKQGELISHNWAEVWIAGAWAPVDPQWPETLGFLPTHYIRCFMNAQKSKGSLETLPLHNLIYMQQGGSLRFEEAR
jgi:tetratricopeptide (TPR) repeat protein